MSIVERLFRIARSRVSEWRHPHQHDDAFRVPFQDLHSQDAYDFESSHTGQRQQAGTDHNQTEYPPGYDPKIAAYYANLELPYGADLQQVKAARKRLMRQYHPDRHSQDPEKRKLAEQLSQGLNLAFHELEKHLKGQTR